MSFILFLGFINRIFIATTSCKNCEDTNNILPKSTLEKKSLLKVVKMVTIGTWFDLCQISQLILKRKCMRSVRTICIHALIPVGTWGLNG